MIRARTRMFGSRTVVLLAEPTHPALGRGDVRRPTQRTGEPDLLGEALLALAAAVAAILLRTRSQPFETLFS